MMRKSGVLFTVLMALVSINVWADNRKEITGAVVDENKEPVTFATVAVSYNATTADSIYLATDIDGLFKLDIPVEADTIRVSLRALGYKDCFYTMPTQNLPDTLRFVMDSNALELAEVVVNGRYYGLSERGDTTVFAVPYFSDGSEHNIGEVIRKMPGMDVDVNGKVSYQGLTIDKVLVNGKDVFTSPDVFINSLPSDFASKLELIENYSDGDVGDGFRTKSRTALNLKSENPAQWNGQLAAMGGVKDKYATVNSVVGLHGPHSLSATFNANNTGQPLFSILDYLKSKGSLETLASNGGGTVNINSDEQKILMPPDNEYQRIGQVGSIDYTYSSRPDYQLKVGGLFHHTKSRGGSVSAEHFINNGIENRNISETENDNGFISLNISNKWNITNQSTFLSKTSFDYGDYATAHNTDNSYTGNRLHTVGDDCSKPYRFCHEMTLNHKLGDGMLYGIVETCMDNNRMSDNLVTPLAFSGIESCPSQDGNTYFSYRKYHTLTMKTTGGFMYPVGLPSTFFKAEVEYSWNRNKLSVGGLNKENRSSCYSNDLSSYVGLLKNTGLFRFDLGIKAGYSSLYGNDLTTSNNKYLILQPKGMLELFFNNRHRASLFVEYKQAPLGIDYISDVSWIIGNNSVHAGSNISNNKKKDLNARFSYRYMSLFNRLTCFAVISYTRIWDDALVESWNEGISSFYRYSDGGEKETWLCQGYLSKGVANLPIEAKIAPKFIVSTINIKNSYGMSDITVTKADISASLTTTFRHFPLNFEASGSYGVESQKIGLPELKTDMTSLKTALKTIFTPVNGLSIALSGKWNRIENDNMSISRYDMDIEASYKFKRLTFGISGQDIFHLSNNEWLSEKISSSAVIQTSYRKLPGFLMGYIKLVI